MKSGKETQIFLWIIALWCTVIGSFIVFYLVIQATHAPLTANQLNYRTCLNNTSYDKAGDCKPILEK